MGKRKTKPKKCPPINLNSNEWIRFDWQRQIIFRHVERGVAKITEQPMSKEWTMEGGCKLTRLDTGERITKPLTYCHFAVASKVIYFDEFFSEKVFAETGCEVTSGRMKR